MDNRITLREAVTDRDIAHFWHEMDQMLLRDVRANRDLGTPMTDEEAAHFLSPDYRSRIDSFAQRAENPVRRFFFLAGGQEVGFACYCTYHTEDGKCFILDYCIYPPYRCRGLGRQCFAALAGWAAEEGARYFELNTHCLRAKRFWEGLGFHCNGYDDGGTILLCRPPEERVPITVERLTDPGDADLGWQLHKLENGFSIEIGEAPPCEAAWDRLCQAIVDGRITFFLARRGYRAVGMCSVSRCFSTFACSDIGVFDDFFVEPVFRRQGIPRQLAAAAQAWCKANGLASLTVGSSPGDVGMYRSLGFTAELGTMLACPLT